MSEPYIHKNFGVTVQGVGYLSIAEEVELPNPEVTTEDHRGSGMAGTIEIDQGLEKMECTITFSGMEPGILASFGLAEGEGATVNFRGAEQAPSGAVREINAQVSGQVKKVESSSFKPGEKASLKVTMTAPYYKLQVAGEDKIEIDMVDGKRVINGVDQYEAIRNAIGA